MVWRASLLALLFSIMAVAQADSPTDAHVVSDVIAQIDAGQFAAGRTAIEQALTANPSRDIRAALEFQRERMRRILLDFTLNEDQVKAKLREQIPDLTDAEFAAWKAAGLFETQIVDGRSLYFHLAASNLFRLSEQARQRRKLQTPFHDSPLQVASAHHREVRDAALAEQRASVAPRQLRVTQSLTVHADAVPAGKNVRAWIPYPRAIPGQQENIRFVSSDPPAHTLAPETAMQRTVFMKKPGKAGAPTKFSVTYELTVHAQYHAIDPNKVVPASITPELAPFVAERPPHIVFSADMRLFSRQIVGDETNPLRVAQKLYAAVDQIPWAGAREYSTISNIGDYALHAGHADCGEQTLLLMTLLRLNGIPTRWQSGMIYSDGEYNDLHDWGWLYIAPYGWIPMDVTFGRLNDPDPAIANFYLGSLDAYRIAFNDDYSREFVPPKKFFRSEPLDLQRGEAEWDGGNLYFDQCDYDFACKCCRCSRAARNNRITSKS